MTRKIYRSYVADILTDPDTKNATPKNRLQYMIEFADGHTIKEIAINHGKSPSHVYIEISRGLEDIRIYAEILTTPNYLLKSHLIGLNNASHFFHSIGAFRSCADVRRAIRNITRAIS